MKKTVYKSKSKVELLKSLMEKKEALRKVRFGTSGSKIRNVKEALGVRRDTARIMTELNRVECSVKNKK